MEVILLERVAKLGQMGDVVRVKDGFARNFLLPQGQGAARHRGQPDALRSHEGRARGAQSRAQGRSREGRRQARRQELHGAAPGRGNRPALRLGVAARHRRADRPRAASRSTAPRSRSTRRSRRSACTRCRSRCIRRSRSRHVAVARNADEAERSRAARTSPSCATRPRRAAEAGGRGGGLLRAGSDRCATRADAEADERAPDGKTKA